MIWPVTTKRDELGELHIGGVSVTAIAEAAGTPVYVYDEATIRHQCRMFRETLSVAVEDYKVAYAAKAWLTSALVQILVEEDIALDVVSGGELYVAIQGGMPAERISFHGNSKSIDELAFAIDSGVGAIVIDNFDEIDRLYHLSHTREANIPVMIRINPGIDAHTHDYRKTGIVDSKFGLGVMSGDAGRAVARVLDSGGLELLGYHAHIGSQIFEEEPFIASVNAVVDFAQQMFDRFGVVPSRLSPGGGFGIPYSVNDPAPGAGHYAESVVHAYKSAITRTTFNAQPQLVIEPGRSIVGNAGVAVYRVEARKAIQGVRTYVSVDGGMADNIRPALYGAVYSAELAATHSDGRSTRVTLAGKFCESGDILIRDVALPDVVPGDLIVVPAAGAYCLAMASNYNMAPRPAVVMVSQGRARLVQRRERYEDLIVRDVVDNQYLTV